MQRRDLLKGLLAIPSVAAAKEITSRTKAILLTIPSSVEIDSDLLDLVKRQARDCLDRAGCEDVEIILLYGIQATTVEG